MTDGGFVVCGLLRKIRPTQLWVGLSWVVAKTSPEVPDGSCRSCPPWCIHSTAAWFLSSGQLLPACSIHSGGDGEEVLPPEPDLVSSSCWYSGGLAARVAHYGLYTAQLVMLSVTVTGWPK